MDKIFARTSKNHELYGGILPAVFPNLQSARDSKPVTYRMLIFGIIQYSPQIFHMVSIIGSTTHLIKKGAV